MAHAVWSHTVPTASTASSAGHTAQLLRRPNTGVPEQPWPHQRQGMQSPGSCPEADISPRLPDASLLFTATFRASACIGFPLSCLPSQSPASCIMGSSLHQPCTWSLAQSLPAKMRPTWPFTSDPFLQTYRTIRNRAPGLGITQGTGQLSGL